MKSAALIARVELALMLRDPSPVILVLAMPLVIMVFLAKGVIGGPAHTVPAMAVLFGFFGIPWLGISFFRDHSWQTWERLRLSPARSVEILIGKAAPFAALFFIQQTVVLTVGVLAFDVPWRGSVHGAALLMASVSFAELSIGLLLVAVCRTVNQLNAVAYLGALMLSGIGGALAPLSRLPGWIEAIAPSSPVYWALEGYDALIAAGQGSGVNLLRAVGALLFVGVVCVLGTVLLYRSDAPKTYFA